METVLQNENEDERKGFPWKTVGAYSIAAMLLVGSVGVFSYVYTERPDVIQQVKLKLDRFGLAPTVPAEVQRIAEINKMTISYEEKQILINKTIFLGATPRMVMLALGEPKEGHRINNTEAGEKSIILVYHLPEDLRPTMLRFENGLLTQAYKGSNIDFDTTPIPYTGINSE